jgi:hypothetical protein
VFSSTGRPNNSRPLYYVFGGSNLEKSSKYLPALNSSVFEPHGVASFWKKPVGITDKIATLKVKKRARPEFDLI